MIVFGRFYSFGINTILESSLVFVGMAYLTHPRCFLACIIFGIIYLLNLIKLWNSDEINVPPPN